MPIRATQDRQALSSFSPPCSGERNCARRTLQQRHEALLDAVLPLLGAEWQRARLSFGENGRFDNPPGCNPAERVEVELSHGEVPRLTRLGETRVALHYNASAIEPARAALTAIAAQGGWPIARDDRSLALLTLAERISGSEIPILLEGPTGTGKEVLARFAHRRSARRGRSICCSQLRGHARSDA